MHNDIDAALAARFAGQIDQQPRDWEGVLAIAGVGGESRALSTIRRWPVPVAAVVMVAVLAAPALAFRHAIGDLIFSDQPPAAQSQVISFAALDREAPAGMAPGVHAQDARRVLSATLDTGEHVDLALAPTAGGGFCSFLRITTTSDATRGASVGCDRDRSLELAGGYTVPGPIRDGVIQQTPVVLSGATLLKGADRLIVGFEDGSSQSVDLAWVSAPIDAGVFAISIPPAHWVPGHLPTTLSAVDTDGTRLASIAIPLVDVLQSSEHH